MRSKGNRDPTLSYQFRTLRAAYNKAIEAKIVAREKNPFIEYKLSHFNTKTIKRALSKNDILKIINANCTGQSKLRQLTIVQHWNFSVTTILPNIFILCSSQATLPCILIHSQTVLLMLQKWLWESIQLYMVMRDINGSLIK